MSVLTLKVNVTDFIEEIETFLVFGVNVIQLSIDRYDNGLGAVKHLMKDM